MKYQCLGYFNQEKMDALPKEEIDAIMLKCRHHLEELHRSGHMLMDAGVAQEVKTLQRVNGKIQIDDSRLADSKKMLGSSFIIEARDMEEAIQIASMHPTVQVSDGEQLGWEIEIRPIDYFEMRE
ncbi:YciI family protein [Planococcus sp. CAU13]|uniref:YciI family protein n=1 Tax=Planococcus sp. CAU13 TaxID=1541197 RepID=UPI00052FF181|nr:YciI family protein [Planococcus sp. CAU13]